MNERVQVKIKNQLELWSFCIIIGAVVGGLVFHIIQF